MERTAFTPKNKGISPDKRGNLQTRGKKSTKD